MTVLLRSSTNRDTVTGGPGRATASGSDPLAACSACKAASASETDSDDSDLVQWTTRSRILLRLLLG